MAKSNFIVTDFPTQEDLDRACDHNMMVLSFVYKPDSIINGATAKAFKEGWLAGRGLRPHHRLALVIVPLVCENIEAVKKSYIKALEWGLTPPGFSPSDK